MITVLKNRKWISESNASNLEDQFSGITKEIFKNQMKNNDRGACGRRYSDEFKQFALTVNFYSPKAYNFLRKVFFLPHPSSIRNWTSSVDCEPGFLSEAFDDLQRQSTENMDMSDCALLVDGMSIRKQILYDYTKSKYVGFTDYGNLCPETTESVASEALVFMLVGLKSRWKCPVGYFMIDKTNADTQSSLIKDCLSMAADRGLRIWSVTCDGTTTNIKTLKNLGCVYDVTYDKFTVKFKHPTRDYHVYGTLDACHMLKNARNCLGDLGFIKNSSGGVIKWDYIKALHDLQQKEGFNLANRLNSTHIQWKNHKMKVKLAAQTLSSSVADALDFLENGAKLPEFAGCGPTIEFIRNIDRLFDFLNSRHKLQTGFKQPVTKNNIDFLEKSVRKICDYLLSLEDMTGQKLVHHRRKTFILGFVSTTKAALSLARELLYREENTFSYFLTYKISQDHIELLFCCVRSRGGFNNNPNVIQFRTALKLILIKNSILVSSKGNCLCFESKSIGSLFSLKWSKRRSPLAELNSDAIPKQASEVDEELRLLLDGVNISFITENILYYISGWVLRNIITTIDCQECAESLLMHHTPSNPDHMYTNHTSYCYDGLVNSKDRGGLYHPCYGVHKLILACEKAFQINVINGPKKISFGKNLEERLCFQVLKSCQWGRYFGMISDHRYHVDIVYEDDHLTQITKQICRKYLNMRLHTYAKRYTRDIVNENVPSVRHRLTKLILFKNN